MRIRDWSSDVCSSDLSPARQRTRLKRDLNALRREYAEDTPLGRRRTRIEEAAPAVEFTMDAMIEKEPVTVVLSKKGWIRAARGHVPLDQEFKSKEGVEPAFILHAQTPDQHIGKSSRRDRMCQNEKIS